MLRPKYPLRSVPIVKASHGYLGSYVSQCRLPSSSASCDDQRTQGPPPQLHEAYVPDPAVVQACSSQLVGHFGVVHEIIAHRSTSLLLREHPPRRGRILYLSSPIVFHCPRVPSSTLLAPYIQYRWTGWRTTYPVMQRAVLHHRLSECSSVQVFA